MFSRSKIFIKLIFIACTRDLIKRSSLNVYLHKGIGEDAAKVFTGYQEVHGNRINGVGVDVASIDVGNSQVFESHVELNSNNIFLIENVANLTVSRAIDSS